MSEPTRDTVKAVFQEVVVAEMDARAALLERLCGEDDALRKEVEELLAAYAKAGEYFPPEATALPGEGPGTVIGRYKLLQQIGEGGFGVVYMAEQAEPVRRKVALKIIKLGMDTKQVIARFEAERQALAMMEHPNIARVLDAGATEKGRPYFVMELVKGVPITEYCDTNALSTRERLRLFTDVCRAVQHAHQKGIIHRDLKPSNVMVTLHDGEPVPKVIDFGISKAMNQPLTEKTLFTEFGQFIGSPVYMSPEQAETSGLDIDTRADIYSLGVLLYELLTGTTPFDPEALKSAGFAEILRLIREQDPPTPSTRLDTLGEALTSVAKHRQAEPGALARLVRGDLDWIVMKALEKNRRRRYDSAAELAADIDRHFNDEPVVARPPSTSYRLAKFARKHRGPVAAALALLGTVTAGFVVSTSLYLETRSAKESENRQRLRAERSSYVANIVAAAASLRVHEIGEAKRSLAACKAHLRGWEWWHLHARTDRSLATLAGHEDSVSFLAVSRDGSRIASASGDGTVRVWDAASRRWLLTLRGHDGEVNAVAFSPDGARIVSGADDGTVRIWDAVSGAPVSVLKGHDGSVQSVTFDPDGTLIASAARDATIRLWDGVSGEPVATLKGHTKLVRPVVFSPDGTKLFSTSLDMTLRSWDASTGALLKTLARYEGFTFGIALAVSPDGRRVYTGTWDKVVRVWDVDTGEALGTLAGHDAIVCALAVSRDGSRIVSGFGDGTIEIWDSASGKRLGTLVGHDGWVSSLAFSPDGTRIFSGSSDGTLRTWSATPSAWPTLELDHGRQVTCVAISPDGKTVASGSRGKTARLWDAETGEHRATLEGHEHWVTEVAFSPDGESIATASRDGTVRIWSVRSGELLRILGGSDDKLYAAAFSPDGTRIAAGSSTSIRIWDTASGELLSTRKGGSVAFSPDGARIVSGSRDGIRVWEPDSGKTLASWSVDSRWGSVVFSADGERVLASDGEYLCAWDAASGERLAGFAADGWDLSIAVFPDGSRFVTAGGAAEARTVRVWDAVNGDALLSLRGHDRQVTSVAVSRDGRRIVSGAVGGSVRIWDTPPAVR